MIEAIGWAAFMRARFERYHAQLLVTYKGHPRAPAEAMRVAARWARSAAVTEQMIQATDLDALRRAATRDRGDKNSERPRADARLGEKPIDRGLDA